MTSLGLASGWPLVRILDSLPDSSLSLTRDFHHRLLALAFDQLSIMTMALPVGAVSFYFLSPLPVVGESSDCAARYSTDA